MPEEYEASYEMHALASKIIWFYEDLHGSIGAYNSEGEPTVPLDALLAAATEAAKAISAGDAVQTSGVPSVPADDGGQHGRKRPRRPTPNVPQEVREGKEPAEAEDADAILQEAQGREGVRKAKKGGGGRARKARNVRAYCGCGCDCFIDFGSDYDGCNCDPTECRNEYDGEDQGACTCIKPKPLAGGVVEFHKDPKDDSRWRWIEAA